MYVYQITWLASFVNKNDSLNTDFVHNIIHALEGVVVVDVVVAYKPATL